MELDQAIFGLFATLILFFSIVFVADFIEAIYNKK